MKPFCCKRCEDYHKRVVKQYKNMDTTKVNRVEVIDHTKTVANGGGRAYVFREDRANVELQLQDDGRTLKIFIS